MEIFRETTRLHRSVTIQPNSSQDMQYHGVLHLMVTQLPGNLVDEWKLFMNVSLDLINACPNNYAIEAFASVHNALQNGQTIFRVFKSSSYQSVSESFYTIEMELPLNIFNNHETSIIISCTPGINAHSESDIMHNNQCKASSIRCPIENGCNVKTSFSETYIGTDYFISNDIGGDSIIAVANGIIEYSYLSHIYGETIIIRHLDDSATLYGNVSGWYGNVGEAVNVGDVIGYSENNYLHFEYVPNGIIFRDKQRIDPDLCIDVGMNGSITVGDSGTVSDDAFRITIDGYQIGTTSIGDWNTINVNNLIPGVHELVLSVIIAPDAVGTYTIALHDGWLFEDGSNEKTHSLLLNHNVTYTFIVP